MDGEGAAGGVRCRFALAEARVLLQELFSVTGVGVMGVCIIDGNRKGGAYHHRKLHIFRII